MDPILSERTQAAFYSIRDRRPPTIYKALNCTYQWGGDNELLDAVGKGADVLMLVECRTRDNKPLDIQRLLGPKWDVQQDMSDAEHSGSATAVRKGLSGLTVGHSSLTLLSPAGHDVQARHLRTTIVMDHGKKTRVGAGHLGLKSTGQQNRGEDSIEDWIERARVDNGVRWVYGGDINQTAAPLARQLGAAHHFGKSPMALMWSRGFDAKTSARKFAHADHYVLAMRSRNR